MEVLFYTIDKKANIDYACMYDKEDQEGMLMKCVEVRMPYDAFLKKFPSFVYDKKRGIVCKRKYLTERFIENVLLEKDFDFVNSSEETVTEFYRDRVIAGLYEQRRAKEAVCRLYEGLTPWIYVTYNALLEINPNGTLAIDLKKHQEKKINPYAIHSLFAKNKNDEVVYIEAKEELMVLESVKMSDNKLALVAKSAEELTDALKRCNISEWRYSIRPLHPDRFYYHAIQGSDSEKDRFVPISGTEYLVQDTLNHVVFAADHKGLCYYMEPENSEVLYNMHDIRCWYANDNVEKDFYTSVTEFLF